jgi:flagellar basal-body rod protein FlgF
MIRGLYGAATALDAAQQNHDVIAQNLANSTMPGYRRQGITFGTFDHAMASASADATTKKLAGTTVSQVFHSFEHGGMQHTGNPLDLAIDGDAFFVLQGPRGPLYTRNGTFKLSADGELQSQNGLPVLGTGGPIRIPPNSANVVITQEGAVVADHNTVGQIQLARFADPSKLVSAGTTLFEAPPGVVPQDGGGGGVRQGYRENSNVNVVHEMVSMIAGARHFEAAQRSLRALSDAIQLQTRPQA